MANGSLQEDHRVDFYKQMRQSIQTWLNSHGVDYKFSGILLTAPDLFHLMCKLVLDKEVPMKYKALLAAAVVYFTSPIDLMP